jgi:ATP-dependent 26S proteasome regulatory subunit
MKRLLTPDPFDADDPDVRAKGALIVGPPGVGKSLLPRPSATSWACRP